MLLVKILFLLLIILIALLIIIFSEAIHVSGLIKYDELSKKFFFKVRYYHINLIYDIKTSNLKLQFNTKFFSFNIKTFELNKSSDEENTDDENTNNQETITEEENKDKDDSENENEKNIKEILNFLNDNKSEMLKILSLLKSCIHFTDSHIYLNIGFKDNNLTIKTCNLLWMILAPFYAVGLESVIIPVINEVKLITDTEISLDIELLTLLKVVITIFTDKKLRTFIFILGDFIWLAMKI